MRLSEWFTRLIHGGTRKFTPSETSILNAVIASLPSAEGELLQQQIAAVSIVQRPQPGRMTICYYSKQSDVPLFERQDYEVCLAHVIAKGPRASLNHIKIMLHRGRLQSIEGRLNPDLYTSDDCEVTLWPSLPSTLPEAADRLEHPDTGNEPVL